MTREQFNKKIRYTSTIYNSCRIFRMENGYKISVINSGNLTKQQMDNILWERYIELEKQSTI